MKLKAIICFPAPEKNRNKRKRRQNQFFLQMLPLPEKVRIGTVDICQSSPVPEFPLANLIHVGVLPLCQNSYPTEKTPLRFGLPGHLSLASFWNAAISSTMAFGVFIHRTDSIYADVPSEQYQFPRQYLSRARRCEGDWIVYLEPTKVRNSKGYFAVAKVQEIIPDPGHPEMYLAVIEPGTYLDFGDPVPFREHGTVLEQGLLNEQGRISGRAQAAVRPLSSTDFARIVGKGLGRVEDDAQRIDPGQPAYDFPGARQPIHHLNARDRVNQLTSRVMRDRNFRKTVLRAYGKRCAITGLRLINGGGRAEVEAAHIRPVEYDGPDIVSNGIALSGTAHWMFDRGLVGLADDLTILVSRQTNDPETVRSMINGTGRLIPPGRRSEFPRSEFVGWHRENCFKQ